MNVTTREEKKSELIDLGYLSVRHGIDLLTTKAVALVSDVQPERLAEAMRVQPDSDGKRKLPSSLVCDMKRGAKGLMAANNTDDMIEILWRQARQQRKAA